MNIIVCKQNLFGRYWPIFRKAWKMSKYNIEITEPAENDLFEIGYYIAKYSNLRIFFD